jgi:2-amino-4-hydroxy-6-hydroxymethyldihydropteridine diphosphokinase
LVSVGESASLPQKFETRFLNKAVEEDKRQAVGGRRLQGSTVGDSCRGQDVPSTLFLIFWHGSMPKSLIGLGANLQHPEKTIIDAVQRLGSLPDVKVFGLSRVYETTPVGGPPGQNIFLNAAILIESAYEASELLAVLQQLETALGRTRDIRWGPRVIDLDLLLYDNLVNNSAKLILPHPRMTFRRFVLHPSCDIAPDMVHPTTGLALERLLNHLNETPNYIVFRGGTEKERTIIMKAARRELLPHDIELKGISESNIQPALDSKTWLMDDCSEDCDTFGPKGEAKIQAPKLLVSLDPLTLEPPVRKIENEHQVKFSGPHLQIGYPEFTQTAAVDEVVAAILAMSLIPVPVSNFPLQGS